MIDLTPYMLSKLAEVRVSKTLVYQWLNKLQQLGCVWCTFILSATFTNPDSLYDFLYFFLGWHCLPDGHSLVKRVIVCCSESAGRDEEGGGGANYFLREQALSWKGCSMP